MALDVNDEREQVSEPEKATLTFKIDHALHETMRERAESLQVPLSTYVREILVREHKASLDEAFPLYLRMWWGYRGQGDPAVIDGAIKRAQGARMTFAFKFRIAFKQMLEHGLI